MLTEANVDYYFNNTQQYTTVSIILEYSFLHERDQFNLEVILEVIHQ
jgi:hypothetical protein